MLQKLISSSYYETGSGQTCLYLHSWLLANIVLLAHYGRLIPKYTNGFRIQIVCIIV